MPEFPSSSRLLAAAFLAASTLVAQAGTTGSTSPTSVALRSHESGNMESSCRAQVQSANGFSDRASSVGVAGNVAADEDGIWPKVQIYWPAAAGPHPVIIYYQDAPSKRFARSARLDIARTLARSANAVVVAVRIRPQARDAAANADVENDGFAAYQWTLANAEALGGDAAQVAVMGESGGSLLAERVSMRASRSRLQSPIYQGLVYPPSIPAQSAAGAHRIAFDGVRREAGFR